MTVKDKLPEDQLIELAERYKDQFGGGRGGMNSELGLAATHLLETNELLQDQNKAKEHWLRLSAPEIADLFDFELDKEALGDPK